MAKILCIDDEEDLREEIVEELEDAGHEIIEAGNGQEGLNAILEHEPDLVVSDITMPVMDGYQLLETLRKNYPKYDEMPFIFLSALADKENVIKGMKSGSDDYITKPIDFEMLEIKVESRVRQAQRMLDKKKEEQIFLYQAMQKKLEEATQFTDNEPGNENEQEANTEMESASTKEQVSTAPAQSTSPANQSAAQTKEKAPLPSSPAEEAEIKAPSVSSSAGKQPMVIVGRMNKQLVKLQELLQNRGHKVTIINSGRAYLMKMKNLNAIRTIFFAKTDDFSFVDIMQRCNDQSEKRLIAAPKKAAAAVLPMLKKLDGNKVSGMVLLPSSDDEVLEQIMNPTIQI